MRSTFLRAVVFTIAAAVSITLTSQPASASIIAFTSFENEDAVGGLYFDTGDGLDSHDLVNHPGEPIVDSTPEGSGAAGDLGFNARYETIGTIGLTEGDEVGVTNNTALVNGAFSDGDQGYTFHDTDGLMILEFDSVNITIPTTFEIDYFVRPTEWESNDSFRIFLTLDGTIEVDIINTSGIDIDNLGIEGSWITGSAVLPGLGSTAVLTVQHRSNADAEGTIIDRVTFTAVPEPASLTLLCFASLALLRRARVR